MAEKRMESNPGEWVVKGGKKNGRARSGKADCQVGIAVGSVAARREEVGAEMENGGAEPYGGGRCTGGRATSPETRTEGAGNEVQGEKAQREIYAKGGVSSSGDE